jgi:hypothetical protein
MFHSTLKIILIEYIIGSYFRKEEISMEKGPKWTDAKDDPKLKKAMENADQITGEGLKELLEAMMENSKKTGATGFEWHAEQNQAESDQS